MANNVDNAPLVRLVPLATWIYENRRTQSVWRRGSPRLHEARQMPAWLKRHEKRLTEAKHRQRWRVLEPPLMETLKRILDEERDTAARKRGWRAS